jgi:hypothetical protein
MGKNVNQITNAMLVQLNRSISPASSSWRRRCGSTPVKALARTVTGKSKIHATAGGPPAQHWRGKMTDYMLTLLSICFTMVTGAVIVGCFSAIVFMALMLWNIVKDFID